MLPTAQGIALDVKRRVPGYEETVEQVNFLWASYTGGPDYQNAGNLDKYPRELDLTFRERQTRAFYLNYVSAVIDAYISAVFKRDPVREVPDSFNEFLDDATGSGESLTDFIRETMTYAMATLRAYVVVDIDDQGAPYCHQLHPANLLDYAKDQDGTFLWAMVAEKAITEDDPFTERVEEDHIRLWMPNEWMLFDDEGRQIDEGPNEADEVPIVEVVPGNMPLPVHDIATINRRIYNLCSQLDEILINVTFPQMYIQSGEGVETETGEAISPDVSPIVIGTGRILQLPTESGMPPGFLAPPDGPAKLHIEERERLISAIYSLAGLERKDPDTQRVQSGVAKAYDFRETNSRLVSIAHAAERAEEEILHLLNAYGFAGEFNVTYQKDFNVRDFTLMLEDYLNIQKTDLPAAAKRRAMMDLAGQIAEDADPEEKQEIIEAVENLPDSRFENVLGPPRVSELLGRNLETANPASAQPRGNRVTTDTIQP
jgi:hypothetical protein